MSADISLAQSPLSTVPTGPLNRQGSNIIGLLRLLYFNLHFVLWKIIVIFAKQKLHLL